jgi:membrane protease YdiL (CAAX protease family)
MKNPDKPLLYFFMIVFSLAWALMALPIAQNYGLLSEQLPLEILLIIGSWVPNIAAFVVIGLIIKRKGGIKNLLKGWLKWRMHPGWYLVALSPILFGLIAIYLFGWIYGYSPSTELLSDPSGLIALLILITITGAMGEELGWRGFALPKLQLRMNALSASILLGIIWSLWHLPLWFAGLGFETIPYGVYMLIGVSFSIMVTAACNSSGGSILIATLFHLFLNVSVNMLENVALPLLAAFFVIAAVVMVAILGPNKLSRVSELPIDKKVKMWIHRAKF